MFKFVDRAVLIALSLAIVLGAASFQQLSPVTAAARSLEAAVLADSLEGAASPTVPVASTATLTATLQPSPATATTQPSPTTAATAIASATSPTTTTATAGASSTATIAAAASTVVTATHTATPKPSPDASLAASPTPTPTGGGSAEQAVQIVVKFKNSAKNPDAISAVSDAGGKQKRSMEQIRTRVITVPASEKDKALAKLSKNSSVERATPAVRVSMAALPTDPGYSQQWALPKIGWDTAYANRAVTGSAKIAVLDTGIDATHPDLALRMATGHSAIQGNPNADPNGHGTAMAGIAAASVNNGIGVAGVAYSGASISSVQVLGPDGSSYDTDVVEGLLWAADNGARVILMAFSSDAYSAALSDAAAYAVSKGAILVAATGNGGTSARSYPAGLPGVIGVAATDQSDTLASYSNTGSADVAAPGTGIHTTLRGGAYGSVSGTSAAAAHVAGLAAMLATGGKSAPDIATQIAGTADHISGSPLGRINVDRALGVQVAGAATPTAVVTPTAVGTAVTYQAAANPTPSTVTSYTVAVMADNPAGWWRLDESSGTAAADYASGGSISDNGVYTNATLDVAGALAGDPDKAAQFNGTSSRVQIPDSSDLQITSADSFTIEAWLNPASANSAGGTIYEKATTDGGTLDIWSRFSNGHVALSMAREGDSWFHVGSVGTIATNDWSHVAFSYDGTTKAIRIYINGVQDSVTGSFGGSFAVANNAPATIGCFRRENWGAGGNYFDGAIDEVALYRSSLSQTRIQEHYRAGKALFVSGAQSVAEDTPITLTGLDLVNPNGSGGSFQTTVSATNGTISLASTTGLTFTSGSGGAPALTFTATEANAKAALNGMSYQGNSDWNGAETITITTSGGTGKNPSATIGVTVNPANDAPRLRRSAVTAVQFDGATTGTGSGNGDYISVPYDPNHGDLEVVSTSGLTLETWLRWDGVSGYNVVLSKPRQDNTAVTSGYHLVITGGKPMFFVASPPSYAFAPTAASSLTPGEWTHVAGSWDGRYARLYVNGVLAASQDGGSLLPGPNWSNQTKFFIGREFETGLIERTFPGSISEARVWSHARDASTIQADYMRSVPGNTVGLVAAWHLNEGSGTTVADFAARGHDGAFAGGTCAPTWTTAPSVTYTEDGSPAVVDAKLLVSDPDNADLAGASVSITSGFLAGDTLGATTTGTSITSSYNAATGVLTLTGGDTVARYQQVLRTVTFSTSANAPGTSRTIGFTVSDGAAGSLAEEATIAVAATNDPPVVTTSGGSASWTEGGSWANVDSGITVSDPDSTTIASATVSITGGFLPDDLLTVSTSGTAITSSYSTSTGVLSLSHSDTVANYQAVLRTLQFLSPSANPTDYGASPQRTVTYIVDDGQPSNHTSTPATRTLNINAVNTGPTLNWPGAAVALAFTEGGAAVDVAPDATVSDPDSLNFDGGHMDMDIVSSPSQTDVLEVRNEGLGAGQIAVSGSSVMYGGVAIGTMAGGNMSPLVITFNANATPAAAQALLRAITYRNSSDDPAVNARSVRAKIVESGGATSGTPSRSMEITAVNDPMVVTVPATQTVNEDATTAISGITVADPDAIGRTVKASLSATNGTLSLTTTSGLTFTTGDGTGDSSMEFTGIMSDVATALAGLRYTGNSNYSGAASITVTVDDQGNSGSGGMTQDTGTIAVTVAGTNDAPTLSGGPYTLSSTDEATASAGTLVSSILAGLTYGDADGGALSGIAITSQTGNGTWQYSTDGATWNGVGSVSGTAALLVSSTSQIRYLPDGINGETAAITFQAWDATSGTASTNSTRTTASTAASGGSSAFSTGTAVAEIVVSSVADAPVVTTSGGSASFTEDGSAVTVDGGITISDVDSTNMASATITIQAAPDGASESLAVDLTGLAGVSTTGYDSGTRSLPIVGSATVATYQEALRRVTYSSSSQNPDTVTRVVEFRVNDGAVDSNTSTKSVGVVAVNDAPVLAALAIITTRQDLDLPMSGISVADIDASASPATIALTALHGYFTIAPSAGVTVTAGSSGSSSVTVEGTLSSLNSAMAWISYRAASGYVGGDTVTITANDQGNTGTGGAKSDSRTIAITVTAAPSDGDSGSSGQGSSPAPTAPPAASTPVSTQPAGSTPAPSSTPVPDNAASPSSTPVLVVVAPASTPIPVTIVTTNVPAGLATPEPDGVVALLDGQSRGTGTISSTPSVWGGASVEIRVDNEGGNRAVSFQPLPASNEYASQGSRITRAFSLEVYNYDPAANSATHRSDDEKRNAAPVVVRIAVSPEELESLGTDARGKPDTSRFALVRVRPDGGTDQVPSQWVANDETPPPAGWVVASFVPRSTYLLVVLPNGQSTVYGELKPDQQAWLEVAYTDGGRYFPETGYSVRNDGFWDYFKKRGGVGTFGYPASQQFVLDGMNTQLFQRAAMQENRDGSVSLVNLLDGGKYELSSLDPVLPRADAALVSAAPSPLDPRFGSEAMAFIQSNVPDEWDGSRVGMFSSYMSTVSFQDVYPNGEGDAGLLPLFNMEVWGLPTSLPVRDPRNSEFVYQRFQRGILHYDAATGLTQPLLLGDEWKKVLIQRGILKDAR